MSILKIAKLGHPVLSKKSTLVEDINDPNIKKLIHDMIETMLDSKGIGLAAPQVHVNKQIIIFQNIEENKKNEENDKEKRISITALINPKIDITSKATENEWEGCLSIPGMTGLVKRYSSINYQGYDMNGKLIKDTAEGLQARVIQHEYDHLMGIVYIQRLVDVKAYGYTDEIEDYWKKNYEKK